MSLAYKAEVKHGTWASGATKRNGEEKLLICR
jgi:hypothetical protein